MIKIYDQINHPDDLYSFRIIWNCFKYGWVEELLVLFQQFKSENKKMCTLTCNWRYLYKSVHTLIYLVWEKETSFFLKLKELFALKEKLDTYTSSGIISCFLNFFLS